MSLLDATGEAFRLMFGGDPELWGIVFISLKVALAGLALAAVPGIVAGYLLAMHRFPGRRALVILTQSLLAFPTVVVGLVLLYAALLLVLNLAVDFSYALLDPRVRYD